MKKKTCDRELTRCFQQRTDCYGYQDGGCGILCETYGANEKPCPFYAKKAEVEAARKKNG